MKFVQHEIVARNTCPAAVGPRESLRIDDLRWAVNSFRLKTGRRIGERPAVIELESITVPGPGVGDQRSERAVDEPLERHRFRPGRFKDDAHRLRFRGPDTKSDTARLQPGSEGWPPLVLHQRAMRPPKRDASPPQTVICDDWWSKMPSLDLARLLR